MCFPGILGASPWMERKKQQERGLGPFCRVLMHTKPHSGRSEVRRRDKEKKRIYSSCLLSLKPCFNYPAWLQRSSSHCTTSPPATTQQKLPQRRHGIRRRPRILQSPTGTNLQLYSSAMQHRIGSRGGDGATLGLRGNFPCRIQSLVLFQPSSPCTACAPRGSANPCPALARPPRRTWQRAAVGKLIKCHVALSTTAQVGMVDDAGLLALGSGRCVCRHRGNLPEPGN